jgi:hypothetical protein
VAQGEALPAADLRRAQDFAVLIWMRSALVAVGAFVVLGVGAKAASASNAVSAGITALILIPAFYAVLAGLQAVMAFSRSGLSKGYLRRAAPEAQGEPLPVGELGLPRQWDFWVVLAVGCAMIAVLAYAGLHSTPH